MRRFAVLELGLLVVFIALLAWAPRHLRLAPAPHTQPPVDGGDQRLEVSKLDEGLQTACFLAAILKMRRVEGETYFLSVQGFDPPVRVLKDLGRWQVRPASLMHGELPLRGRLIVIQACQVEAGDRCHAVIQTQGGGHWGRRFSFELGREDGTWRVLN